MLINTLAQVIKKARRKLYVVAAFAVMLSLIACINQSSTSVDKVNVESKPSTNNVIQVDGRVASNTVLQITNSVEPNNTAVLLTPAGAVNSQGDRTVQVTNHFAQNGSDEQSTLTILDSNATPLVTRELQWFAGPVKFSPDGSRIITSGSDRTTRIWDTQLNQLASFDGHQMSVQSLQISPDGNYILTTEYPDATPPSQPMDQGSTARLLDLKAIQLASFQGLQTGANQYKYVQFSPDSQRLLAVIDGAVQAIDLQGNPQLTFNQNQQGFSIAQFSPDGRTVLAAGSEIMNLWDSQGQLTAEFSHWTVNPVETIASIQLSPNGQLIATGSSTGLLRFWDAQNNSVVTVKAHEGEIHAIAISPDGTQIATLGERNANMTEDTHIRIWDRRGQLLDVLGENLSTSFFRGVQDKLTDSFSLQFTADGTQIIAAETAQGGTTIRWTF